MSTNKLELSGKTSKKITPDMVGLFFEDINFAADGGLYAEMIENRSFEAVKSCGENHNYVLQEDNLYAWASTDKQPKNLIISFNQPVSQNNPHYLRFIAKKAGEGFSNKAYDGISLKKGMKYKLSFYAREVDYPKGNITALITKKGTTYAKTEITFKNAVKRPKEWMDTIKVTCDTMDWAKYEAVIEAKKDVQNALFELHLTKPGTVEFDLISLIPEDAVAGVFRKDLFEALKGINPAFLRFPGGCIVEGTSIMRRYQWKNTVGDLKDRKINTCLWAVQGGNTIGEYEMQDCHYMQSYGIGFYEYFLLCELLSGKKRVCKPLPVLNIGVACQFRSYETVPVDSPEFQEYIQDALDLIEFANGPVTSKWGSLRAKMGHPKSFNLELLAIGNEQWESGAVDLAPRYIAFEKAIHKKYPKIKCLGTAGPFINHPLHTSAWNFYRTNIKKNKAFTYAVDEHYYVAPKWLYDNVTLYDNYPRDIKVFAGEYAAHDDNLSNSVEGAVAEAAMMTGMEKNGDLVEFASYAPLFNRIGHSQWTPDLIWFDADKVVLTPSYYVQKIFSDYAGCEALELNGQEKALRKNGLYVSAVKNGSKTIIKIVNGSDQAQTLELTDTNGKPVTKKAEIVTLQAANGKAKKVVPTNAVDTSAGNKVLKGGIMSNLQVCKKRAPEEAALISQSKTLSGTVELTAKSVMVVIL
ncbi:MAG: carbohydrate binding domain-containing protein [Treponema sp.]|nr:carbohydrate binding domain-containing protein [Treponema sp.]